MKKLIFALILILVDFSANYALAEKLTAEGACSRGYDLEEVTEEETSRLEKISRFIETNIYDVIDYFDPVADGYKSCSVKQKGIASVYGIPGRDKFAGKKTASGEKMNPTKFRAALLRSAGQTYPFGTWVRVSNGEKSVLACLNDTGRGKKGRIIDLTSAAANAIDNGDLGEVEVECLLSPVKGHVACDDNIARLLE